MCNWLKMRKKWGKHFPIVNQYGLDTSLDHHKIVDYKKLTGLDVEMMERALGLEEKRHRLDTKMAMDKIQIIFSRILVAAAIVTLTLILLSSFEIPYVHVSTEFVKLMISAVIVEIAGIVSIGLMKNLGKEDKEENENK